jgi:hypothetical protein
MKAAVKKEYEEVRPGTKPVPNAWGVSEKNYEQCDTCGARQCEGYYPAHFVTDSGRPCNGTFKPWKLPTWNIPK